MVIKPIQTKPAPPPRVPTEAELKLKALLAWQCRYGHMSKIMEVAKVYPA